MSYDKPEVMPSEGGSYIRNEDGTLTRVVPPTKVSDAVTSPPVPEASSEE